jgi:hypothetical protein
VSLVQGRRERGLGRGRMAVLGVQPKEELEHGARRRTCADHRARTLGEIFGRARPAFHRFVRHLVERQRLTEVEGIPERDPGCDALGGDLGPGRHLRSLPVRLRQVIAPAGLRLLRAPLVGRGHRGARGRRQRGGDLERLHRRLALDPLAVGDETRDVVVEREVVLPGERTRQRSGVAHGQRPPYGLDSRSAQTVVCLVEAQLIPSHATTAIARRYPPMKGFYAHPQLGSSVPEPDGTRAPRSMISMHWKGTSRAEDRSPCAVSPATSSMP